MKRKKRFFILPAVAVLILVLLAVALLAGKDDDNPIGSDWRTWGITRDGGIITRGGEDTYVLVCVNKMNATFYYDTEDQTPFGWVYYPIAFEGDVWDLFKGIDFADLNDDGDSDVTMWFDGGDSDITLVWYWDAGSGTFVYQPDSSSTGGRRSPDEISTVAYETPDEYYDLFSLPVVERVLSPFWAINNCTESGLDLTPFSAWDSGSDS